MSLIGDNKLKKIYDSRQIGHQLLSVKESQEEAFVWRFVGNKKILAPIKFEIIKKAKEEFQIKAAPGHEALFQEVIGSSDKLNFFLPHTLLLFQSKLQEINHDGSVLVLFPEFLAQLERRKWLRMNCENKVKIKTQFCKQVLEPKKMSQFFGKSLVDMSGGGFSLLASKAESKFFLSGEVIKNLELIIEDEKILVDVETVKVQEISTYDPNSINPKAWKISFKFQKITKKHQDFLIKFVFQHLSENEKAI
ncbi:MAG: PilZ domain-containing protein [Bacteriovoracaceae bacterium]|nr:PilZ domain-containing protein [Bacteriovoracaceae bacterium]